MKILLDECLPKDLRKHLVGHDCETVPQAGFAGKARALGKESSPWLGEQFSSPAIAAVSAIETNPSTNWRIESKCFFNFADALTAGVIQV